MATPPKPANQTNGKPAAKPLSITGYVIQVLKMRESMAPKEEKLLARVPEQHREAAKAQLAKMDRA